MAEEQAADEANAKQAESSHIKCKYLKLADPFAQLQDLKFSSQRQAEKANQPPQLKSQHYISTKDLQEYV